MLRGFLYDLKGGYEFDVNGNILEATLYDKGVDEVMSKIKKDKATMLFQSDDIFRNARYLYSTQDKSGNPNIYRWNYFYTPVQIGNEIVGVRIAVRDMVRGTYDAPKSQIYNWKLKSAPLDGGSHSPKVNSSDVSSDALTEGESLNDNISHSAESRQEDNIDLQRRRAQYEEQKSQIEELIDSFYKEHEVVSESEQASIDAARKGLARTEDGILAEERVRDGLVSKNYGKPENHIDNRTTKNVSSSKIKAFQIDHPELHRFYRNSFRWIPVKRMYYFCSAERNSTE